MNKILADGPAVDGATSRVGYEAAGPKLPAAIAQFGSNELRGMEAAFALHVGPIAKYLVQRRALLASDMEDLIRRLAGEIASERDLIQFIAACRLSQSR